MRTADVSGGAATGVTVSGTRGGTEEVGVFVIQSVEEMFSSSVSSELSSTSGEERLRCKALCTM